MTTIGVSENKTELCITIENRKQMYKEKREEKIEDQKKYNKMNAEEIQEYQRQYYLKRKEALSIKNTTKVTCCCGKVVSQSTLRSHQNTSKHIKTMEQRTTTV